MATGDIIELRDVQIFNGAVEMLNVYHYFVADGASDGNDALHCAEMWTETVLPLVKGLQSNLLVHTSVEAVNLLNPADFTSLVYVPAVAGDQTGEALPPYNTFTFQFVRATRAVRHGWKRIGGIPEIGNTNGVASAGFLTTLADIADAMASTLEDGDNSALYTPRIVRKTYVDGLLTDVQSFNINGVVYRHIGTQNSRKFGVGS